MDDRSGKSATRQQVLIVNDLAGNTKSYKPATCCSFLGKVEHYRLEVNAMTQPMILKEDAEWHGGPPKNV
jgi:hypothetical protein